MLLPSFLPSYSRHSAKGAMTGGFWALLIVPRNKLLQQRSMVVFRGKVWSTQQPPDFWLRHHFVLIDDSLAGCVSIRDHHMNIFLSVVLLPTIERLSKLLCYNNYSASQAFPASLYFPFRQALYITYIETYNYFLNARFPLPVICESCISISLHHQMHFLYFSSNVVPRRRNQDLRYP